MKLRVLAIAIAAASMTVSVQAADIKFGGDFHVGYKSDDSADLKDYGSELWFDIEQKAGSLTFIGHAELELDGGIHGDSSRSISSTSTSTTTPTQVYYLDADGNQVPAVTDDGEPLLVEVTDTNTNTDTNIVDEIEVDEIYVGVKGSFGTIRVGDIENACDKLEYGGDWNEFLAASDSRGDCGGEHEGTILYTKKMGNAEIGVSHNSDHDESSVAVRYKVNKNLKVALGHVNKKDSDNITSASVTADIGKFGLKARVNNGDIGDYKEDGSRSPDSGAHYSVFGAYNLTKKSLFNVGFDSDETVSVGYRHTLAKNTYFFAEAAKFDGKDGEESNTRQALGVQYKF